MLVLYPLRSGSQVLFSISFESRVRVPPTSPALQSRRAVRPRAHSLFANLESGGPAILAALPFWHVRFRSRGSARVRFRSLACSRGFARPDSGAGSCSVERGRAARCACVCGACVRVWCVLPCSCGARSLRAVRSCDAGTIPACGRLSSGKSDSRAGACALVCGARRCAGLVGLDAARALVCALVGRARGALRGACSCALVCGRVWRSTLRGARVSRVVPNRAHAPAHEPESAGAARSAHHTRKRAPLVFVSGARGLPIVASA